MIASDGLWDISTGKQASKIAHAKPPQPAAQLLVLTAQKKDSRDDITVTVIDLLPYDRRAEKLVWSLPNGQTPSNLTMPEVADEMVVYDPMLNEGAIPNPVRKLRAKRIAISEQIKSANAVLASRSEEIRKERAERNAEKEDMAEALRISMKDASLDHGGRVDMQINEPMFDEWTVKPKKVSKKMEATALMADQGVDLLIEVLLADATLTIAMEETKKRAEEEARRKAAVKQREKKLQKQREEKMRRKEAAKERQRQLELLEQEKQRTLIATAIHDADEDVQQSGEQQGTEDAFIPSVEMLRKQQERDAAEKIAAMAAREALGGASRIMQQNKQQHDNEHQQQGKGGKGNGSKNKKKNDNKQNRHNDLQNNNINNGRREKMNGLNKSELMQVKAQSKVNIDNMLSASELEASFQNNGWGELSVEPPPGTNFAFSSSSSSSSLISPRPLPPNSQSSSSSTTSSNSMAVSFESEQRIIPMSPIMKPLKPQQRNEKRNNNGTSNSPPSIAKSLFGDDSEDVNMTDHSSVLENNINSSSSSSSNTKPNSNKVLHVSKYPKGTTKEMIGQVLSQYAEVTRVFQKEHGKISYCFVTMRTSEDAFRVMSLLNNNTMVFSGDGEPHQPLKVEIAADKDNSSKMKKSNRKVSVVNQQESEVGADTKTSNDQSVGGKPPNKRKQRKPRANKGGGGTKDSAP